jgi:membrane associated rhomboid family serine protease
MRHNVNAAHSPVGRNDLNVAVSRSVSAISPMLRKRKPPRLTSMLPLSDGIPARRFPIVNVAIIIANFAVWLFYELPHLNSSIFHSSFYPCTVTHACHGPEPWGISWITAMFLHGSWDHILGNMLFLAVFGKNVEDAFGHLRYLGFYFVGGFVAMMTQTLMTLAFATRQTVVYRTSERAARSLRSSARTSCFIRSPPSWGWS